MGRRDDCPKCEADARVCLNCRFYDHGSHHECREEQAEWVKEKNRGSFCGYFDASADSAKPSPQLSNAKQDLDALFGGGKSTSEQTKEAGLAGDLEKFLKERGR